MICHGPLLMMSAIIQFRDDDKEGLDRYDCTGVQSETGGTNKSEKMSYSYCFQVSTLPNSCSTKTWSYIFQVKIYSSTMTVCLNQWVTITWWRGAVQCDQFLLAKRIVTSAPPAALVVLPIQQTNCKGKIRILDLILFYIPSSSPSIIQSSPNIALHRISELQRNALETAVTRVAWRGVDWSEIQDEAG